MREEASKPTVGGGGGATGSGGGLVFEMRGSLKVLLGQVEKDLGKRQMSTEVTTSSTAERNCARVPSLPRACLGLCPWAVGSSPTPGMTAGDLREGQHLLRSA